VANATPAATPSAGERTAPLQAIREYLAEIGIAPDETYELHELLGGDRRLVRGATHAVTLDPRAAPAHIYRVGRWRRRERDFDYFA